MEVLEQGEIDGSAPTDDPAARRGWLSRIAGRITVVALALAVISVTGWAAWSWWSAREALPERLEVMSVAVAAPAVLAVTDEESGWPGGLGTPARTSAPAALIRVEVSGDPRRDSLIAPAGTGPAIVTRGEPALVPQGSSSTLVEIALAPTDCSWAVRPPSQASAEASLGSATTPLTLLSDPSGANVPLSAQAQSDVLGIVADLCAPAGAAPSLKILSAGVDVFFRDRTLVMSATLQRSEPRGRALVVPLDATALRGLGAGEAGSPRKDSRVRLSWLISPGEMTPNGSLSGLVQVYVIIDGTSYPWVLSVPVDLRAGGRSLLPLRQSPGQALADLAPRPS